MHQVPKFPAVALTLALAACMGDPATSPRQQASGPNLHVIDEVCDFITFGRLIVEDDAGNQIVISGNAGGNKPGGGILGEFEVHVGDAKYTVHEITQYGIPAANDPFGLFGGNQNARVIVGETSDGTDVHLRLVDNPAPGEGEPGPAEGDQVYLQIPDGGTVILSARGIDQGNVQLHTQCRGPKI